MGSDADNNRPKLLPVTCICAAILFVVLVTTTITLWQAAGEDRSYIIQWVPVYVLQWGFCGGMVAVLYRLAVLRGSGLAGQELYTWVVAKPIMGTIMGGLVYLLATGGELALNGAPRINNYAFLCALAFLGGFSDRFSVGLLSRLAGKWAETDGREGRKGEPLAEPVGCRPSTAACACGRSPTTGTPAGPVRHRRSTTGGGAEINGRR